MIDGTLFAFKFTGISNNILAMIFWGSVATAVRLGAVYVAIRVVVTAFSHGSF